MCMIRVCVWYGTCDEDTLSFICRLLLVLHICNRVIPLLMLPKFVGKFVYSLVILLAANGLALSCALLE